MVVNSKPRKLFVGTADRLFAWVALIALIVSALCAAGILDGFGNSALITFLSNIIPGTDSVATRTAYPVTARVTFSIQWLFFPVYLVLMCAYRLPFKPIRPCSVAARRDLRSRAVRVLPMTLMFLLPMLVDWDVLPGPSFFRGSVWQPDFALTTLPYDGRSGLALAGFVTPVVEALIYWLVPTVICAYLISSLLPARDSTVT